MIKRLATWFAASLVLGPTLAYLVWAVKNQRPMHAIVALGLNVALLVYGAKALALIASLPTQ